MRKKIAVISREEIQEFVESEPLISSWLSGYAEGTKYNYGRALLRYTRFHEMTAEELLELGKGEDREAERLLDAML